MQRRHRCSISQLNILHGREHAREGASLPDRKRKFETVGAKSIVINRLSRGCAPTQRGKSGIRPLVVRKLETRCLINLGQSQVRRSLSYP